VGILAIKKKHNTHLWFECTHYRPKLKSMQILDSWNWERLSFQ